MVIRRFLPTGITLVFCLLVLLASQLSRSETTIAAPLGDPPPSYNPDLYFPPTPPAIVPTATPSPSPTPPPTLRIDFLGDQAPITLGSITTYTIAIHNPTAGTISDLAISAVLPTTFVYTFGVTFASDYTYTGKSGAFAWDVPALAPNTALTATFQAYIPPTASAEQLVVEMEALSSGLGAPLSLWNVTTVDTPVTDGRWVTPDGGGHKSVDTGFSVLVPEATLTDALYFDVVTTALTTPTTQTLWTFAGFTALTRDNNLVSQFPQSLTLAIHITQLAASENIAITNTPTFYWWDEANDELHLVPSEMNWQTGMLTAQVDHFSGFGVGPGEVGSYGAQHLPTIDGFVSDPSSGNSGASVSFALPPAPGGMPFALGLAYSSEGVNSFFGMDVSLYEAELPEYKTQAGIVGWGWNLTGLGTIRRDNSRANTDRAWLAFSEGSFEIRRREILTDGSALWDTDPQTFVRIQSNESDSRGSSQWIVWAKNGTRYVFGSPTMTGDHVAYAALVRYPTDEDDTDFCDNAEGNAVLREAALNQIIDTHGNTIEITYAREDANYVGCDSDNHDYIRAMRPTLIEYFPSGEGVPTAQIQFNYNDPDLNPRSDTEVVGYLETDNIQALWTKYRLRSVEAYVRDDSTFFGWSLFRHYELDQSTEQFPEASDKGIMVLDEVQDGGSNGASGYLPATTFTYEKLDNAWINTLALVAANNGQGGEVAYGYDTGEVYIHPCSIIDEFAGPRPGEGYRFYVDAMTTTDGIDIASLRGIDSSGGWARGGRFNDAHIPSADCADRFEFAGYETVTTTQQSAVGVPLQVTVTKFHQKYQADAYNWYVSPKAGMAYETRVYDPTPYGVNDGLLQIISTTWLTSTQQQRDWVYKSKEVETTLDPISPALSIALTTTYEYVTGIHQNYRQYGNVTHIREYDENGLFRLRDFFYSPYSTTADYIVNKPRNQRVWSGEAGASTCVSHTVLTYDDQVWPNPPTKGDLTGIALATTEGEALGGCDADYLSTGYDYDIYGNQTVITDTRGYVTLKDYDVGLTRPNLHAYPLTVTVPSVNGKDFSSLYQWDAYIGQVRTVTDVNGIATHYDYDEFARLTKVWRSGDTSTNPTEWYTYTNYVESPLSPYRVETSQRMSGTVHVPSWMYYDGMGREVQAWSLYYTDNAQIASVNLKGYDALGGEATVFAPVATTLTLQFLPPGGFWTGHPFTTVAYDAFGRPETLTAADGTTATHVYGVAPFEGNFYHRTAVIDANHHRDVSAQDAAGRTIYNIEYEGNCASWQPGYPCGGDYTTTWTRYATTTYAYDAADRMLTVTDALNNVSAMTYDLAGRKLAMDDPDKGLWEYQHDAAGNVTAQIDSSGHGICFSYDALNRPTQKKVFEAIVSTPTTFCSDSPSYAVQYTYDSGINGIGRRTGMTDPTGSTAWKYDTRGRVISETKSITVSTTSYVFTTLSTYDSADRLRSAQYPADANGALGELVTYNYTDGHQMMLRGVSSVSDTYVSGIQYNVYGQILEQVYGTSTPVAQNYTYWDLDTPNGQGRVRSMTAVRGSVMASLLSFQYATAWNGSTPGYDAMGNIVRIGERRWTGPSTSFDQWQEFSYDDLDRLITAEVSNSGISSGNSGIMAQEDYTYDEIGNLVERYSHDLQANPLTEYDYTTPPVSGCPGTATTTPKAHAVYATVGRMTNTYCYDAVGNMVHREYDSKSGTISQTLIYDAENRLKRVQVDGDIASAFGIATFAYDGAGNRVRATMGGVTTLYIGGHTEYKITIGSPSSATLVSYYSAGEKTIAMRQQVVGGSDTLYFLLGDHLGSTSATLAADGTKVADLRYSAWGLQRWSSGTTPTRTRYTGQIDDVETGLYFYNSRYYDPTLARFIQADTVVPNASNPQTLNRYAYVGNNPLRYTDPSGNTFWDVVDAIFWGISFVQFSQNPTLANGFWLAVDSVSLVPVVPSLQWFRYTDEGAKLLSSVQRLVQRGGLIVGEHFLKAVNRFGNGNGLFPSGAHIAMQFGKVLGIPGAERLLQRLANQAFPRVKGDVFHLDYAASIVDKVQEIERQLGGGRAIDLVLTDGTFVDTKFYNWASEAYNNPYILQQVINKFLEQYRIYSQYTNRVEFVFKGSVPDAVRQALEAAGAIVTVIP